MWQKEGDNDDAARIDVLEWVELTDENLGKNLKQSLFRLVFIPVNLNKCYQSFQYINIISVLPISYE